MHSDNTKMTANKPYGKSRSKDGIALIIVLGLLGVLVIFGLAFSVSMRTERLATRAYVDVVKARHLTHTALYRVLGQHINGQMANQVYPPWDAYRVQPGPVNLLGDRTMTSAAVFVPMSLRSAVFAQDGVSWLELRDPQNNNFYGEYTFLVVNCSGLLDANVIGDRENLVNPRGYGRHPNEIRFHSDVLPEARPGSQANLRSYRGEFTKFESVPELYYLTSTIDFDGINPPENSPLLQNTGPLTGSMADHLHVFSRYPKGYANGQNANTNIASIQGLPSLWDLPAIREVVSGLSPSPIPNVDHMVAAIYDFADEGFIPYGSSVDEQFRRFSSKPVPMINEVIVSNTVQLVMDDAIPGQTVMVHRIHIDIETWYPFPTDPDNPVFSVQLDGLPQISTQPVYPTLQGDYNLESGPNPVSFSPSAANPFHITRFVYIQYQNVGASGQPPYAPGQMRTRVRIPGDIRVMYGDPAVPVDIVFGPWASDAFEPNGNRPALVVDDPPGAVGSVGKSVNDPRINWNPLNSTHWGVGNATITPNDINIGMGAGAEPDEVGIMYGGRRPFMSAAELTYLLYDENRPWTTIRLLGSGPGLNPAPLIDRLTSKPDSDYPQRGLVNINSRQDRALAAAFYGMPLDTYPGATFGGPLSATNAISLGAHIAGNQPIYNLSDINTAINANFIDSIIGSNNKFQRESLIRNSFGLIGTRHNLFTIFIAARTFADGYNPSNAGMFASRDQYVTSEQRAVAVVWRDPLVTFDEAGNTTHQSFIQYFHWFSGAFGD